MVISVFSKLVTFKNVVKRSGTFDLLMRNNNCMTRINLCSAASNNKEPNSNLSENKQEEEISDVMKLYLERSKAHDDMVNNEIKDYKLGRLHLANIMGANLENFTAKDIDRSIQYLFPSGLFDKKARPLMKHPKEILPPKKAAEFDYTGRPFHSLFYTTKPNYYQTLYDIVEHMNNLDDLEDRMIENKTPIPKNDKSNASYRWISYKDFKNYVVENITEEQYEYFISTISRLEEHPLSHQVSNFILKFKVKVNSSIKKLDLPKFLYDDDSRPYVIISDCRRKKACATVKVTGQGSGKITINGQLLSMYFPNIQERQQIVVEEVSKKIMNTISKYTRNKRNEKLD